MEKSYRTKVLESVCQIVDAYPNNGVVLRMKAAKRKRLNRLCQLFNHAKLGKRKGG